MSNFGLVSQCEVPLLDVIISDMAPKTTGPCFRLQAKGAKQQ